MYNRGEIILVICVFLFIFGCFSIPILIYATSGYADDPDFSSEEAEIGIDVNNCPQQVAIAIIVL